MTYQEITSAVLEMHRALARAHNETVDLFDLRGISANQGAVISYMALKLLQNEIEPFAKAAMPAETAENVERLIQRMQAVLDKEDKPPALRKVFA